MHWSSTRCKNCLPEPHVPGFWQVRFFLQIIRHPFYAGAIHLHHTLVCFSPVLCCDHTASRTLSGHSSCAAYHSCFCIRTAPCHLPGHILKLQCSGMSHCHRKILCTEHRSCCPYLQCRQPENNTHTHQKQNVPEFL